MKRAYYTVMFLITDSIMWFTMGDRDHWYYWWNVSENYRKLRERG